MERSRQWRGLFTSELVVRGCSVSADDWRCCDAVRLAVVASS